MKKLQTLAPMLALCLATGASHASMTFDYSYTFASGLVMSGSLEGDRVEDFVQNVANVSVFFNGTPMSGTVFTARYTGNTWVTGPVVSFDPLQNNFLFVNSDYLHHDYNFNEAFYMLNASVYADRAYAWSQPLGYDGNEYTIPGNWSLTEHVVPEPSTYFAGIGCCLALLGSFVRRVRK